MKKRTFQRTRGTLAGIPNDGKPLQLINVNGEPCVMINDKYYCDGTSSILHECLDNTHTYNLKKVPPNCYSEIETNTGGLGIHIRWLIYKSNQESDDKINILIGLFHHTPIEFQKNIESINHLLEKREDPIHFVECDSIIEGKCINNVCAFKVSKSNLKYVASFVLYHSYYIEVENNDDLTKSTLACERLDRAEHMWVYQCKEDALEAGPLRKNTNWKQNFTPWDNVIFTWKALSKCILSEIRENMLENISKYPEPLKTYLKKCAQDENYQEMDKVINEQQQINDKLNNIKLLHVYSRYTSFSTHFQKLHHTDEVKKVQLYKNVKDINYIFKKCLNNYINMKAKLNNLYSKELHVKNTDYSAKHLFMNRLTKQQMVQLLSAYWYYNIGPCDEKETKDCKLILFGYFLYGYYVRTIADYRATAENVGKSETIRPLSKKEYNKDKLPIEVINRIYRTDGEWKGSGFRGSKGRHPPPEGVKVYKPLKRRKRVDSVYMKSTEKPF